MSDELKAIYTHIVSNQEKLNQSHSAALSILEDIKSQCRNYTCTPDINAEMLKALKECVVFQCQMCTGDIPEDCEGNGITCDYHDYKAIIQKAEKETT